MITASVCNRSTISMSLEEASNYNTYLYDSVNIIGSLNNLLISVIIVDHNFINNLNSFLSQYKGSNENYIKLMCKEKILNSINIYKIDDNFVMPNDTNIIYAIFSYKKYVYLTKTNDNKVKLNNIYNDIEDEYYCLLFHSLIYNISYDDIIEKTYIELILSLPNKYELLFLYNLDILDDYNFIIKAVQIKNNLKYASERLKDNYDIALTAVKANGISLQFISDRLKDNENIALAAVSNNYYAFLYVSDKLKDTESFVSTVVKKYNSPLEFASDRLKDDYDFILPFIKRNEYNLSCVSDRLKDNENFILTSIKNNPRLIKYASERLKNDINFLLPIISVNSDILSEISIQMRDNYDIVLTAVNNKWTALYYASDRLKDNYDIVLAAIKNNSNALMLASERLKDNYDLVVIAITYNISVITFASKRLQCNSNIIAIINKK